MSMAICFMRVWYTRLCVRYVALRLSHKIEGVEEEDTPNSMRREVIQDNSAAVFAKDRYSASVDDLATAFCLDDFHEMRLGP